MRGKKNRERKKKPSFLDECVVEGRVTKQNKYFINMHKKLALDMTATEKLTERDEKSLTTCQFKGIFIARTTIFSKDINHDTVMRHQREKAGGGISEGPKTQY